MFHFRITNFVVILICCLGVMGQEEVGDECLTDEGLTGVCRDIRDCQSVLDNIEKGKYPTDMCGFIQSIIIVCCVPQKEVTPRIRAPISTESTTHKVANRVNNQPGDKANEN
ncbi:uncharacterized protein LOC114335344 isoform X1 [Diabrotica virgifera virgifera]|uniref:Uncharacterized protein LOC114335344 n=1 Tax=Diabrotica virgifera virgifera TaxID=50390 RepID=A0A6P7G2Y0_DIAVI|nr:uncharacterized protein LOC114335344 isoform X1 [Diabrotica virgifera virgifera]